MFWRAAQHFDGKKSARPPDMLPPGTLAALKGQKDAVVAVVCLAMTLGAIPVGVPPLAAICLMVFALVGYIIRTQARERYDIEMARLRVEQASVNVAAVKALRRELAQTGQPALPLEDLGRWLPLGKMRKRKP